MSKLGIYYIYTIYVLYKPIFIKKIYIYVASMSTGANGRQVGNLVSCVSVNSNSTQLYIYIRLDWLWIQNQFWSQIWHWSRRCWRAPGSWGSGRCGHQACPSKWCWIRRVGIWQWSSWDWCWGWCSSLWDVAVNTHTLNTDINSFILGARISATSLLVEHWEMWRNWCWTECPNLWRLPYSRMKRDLSSSHLLMKNNGFLLFCGIAWRMRWLQVLRSTAVVVNTVSHSANQM